MSELSQAKDSREINNAYLRSLPDVCKCGHGRMEHYDGHDFCTWAASNECLCETYEARNSSQFEESAHA